MNPFEYDGSPHMNPTPPIAAPAAYGRAPQAPFRGHQHGQPWVRLLEHWAQSINEGDQVSAAEYGGELLQLAMQVGAVPDVAQGLRNALQQTMQRVADVDAKVAAATRGGGGACGTADAKESDLEAIDWRAPDPRMYYELDQRSGVELRKIAKLLKHPGAAVARGARVPNRQLYVGAPGNGKTQGALWLASQLDRTVALIRIDATMIGQVGAIARRVRNCFEEAHARGAMVVIDEFEALAVPRNNMSPNVPQWSRETTSALLQLFDDPKLEDLVVVACTNYVHLVDEAVRRRLRRHVVFYAPDRPTREAMLRRWWEKVPHDDGARARMIDLTTDCSGDVLQRAAEEANLIAFQRAADARVTAGDVTEAFAVVTATSALAALAAPAPMPMPTPMLEAPK